MNKQKITQDSILESIEKTAQMMVRKYELYESVKQINGELKTLYESAPPMVGSYGFASPSDSISKNGIGGFESTPNISFIAQLEKEMGIKPEEENALNEVETLKLENEKLKKELEELKGKK